MGVRDDRPVGDDSSDRGDAMSEWGKPYCKVREREEAELDALRQSHQELLEALESLKQWLEQTHTGDGYDKAHIAERLLLAVCQIDATLANARKVQP